MHIVLRMIVTFLCIGALHIIVDFICSYYCTVHNCEIYIHVRICTLTMHVKEDFMCMYCV